MQGWYSTFTLVVSVILIGCSQTIPPPPGTRAADEQAIRELEVAWVRDWAAKDVEKILSQYADDAKVMVPGAPMMSGKEAIRAGLKVFVADPNLSLMFTTVSTQVSRGSDLAYTTGTYRETLTDPKTKKPVTETGNYVTVYKKQNGTWKAVADISTPEGPTKPVK